MSRVTKRKHVMKEMLADDFEHPTEKQQIARVVRSRGNNLHEVETADLVDNIFLVSMPTKFRNNVWIKRGNYVIIEAIDEGDKVKAEIVRILTPEYIKEFTKDGIWPSKFMNTKKSYGNEVPDNKICDNSNDDDDNDDDLFKNTNRKQHIEESSSEESETNSDDDNIK